MHCKVKVVELKKCFTKIVLNMIFVFVIQQYNLMACDNFSLIGYDPKVFHKLAGGLLSILPMKTGDSESGYLIGNYVVQMEISSGNVQLKRMYCLCQKECICYKKNSAGNQFVS